MSSYIVGTFLVQDCFSIPIPRQSYFGAENKNLKHTCYTDRKIRAQRTSTDRDYDCSDGKKPVDNSNPPLINLPFIKPSLGNMPFIKPPLGNLPFIKPPNINPPLIIS